MKENKKKQQQQIQTVEAKMFCGLFCCLFEPNKFIAVSNYSMA